MSEMQSRLVKRCRTLQLSAKPAQSEKPDRLERIVEESIEINMLAEPVSVTEIEFSNEMKLKLAKYAT